jgi:hypothetical protein
MQAKRRTAYQLEWLESRQMLSTVPVLLTVAVETARVNAARRLSLTGRIDGTFLVNATPTTQVSASVDGSGTVRPLGSVEAEGSLSGSLVPGGNVRGSLTLSNGSGEVRLSLNGTIPRSTRAPAQARFQILSGTGAYAGSTGTGTARIRLQAISVNASTGSFSLQLSPSTSRR